MKVAVLANCQGESIAACARAMSPGVQFEFVSVTEFWSGARTIPDTLRGFDKIFAQNSFRSYIREQDSARVFFFPTIAFAGFQPDMTYLRGKLRGHDAVDTITNEMVMYHSNIVLTGYVAGLDIDGIVALFQPETYSKLGYLDCWEAARKALLKEGVESEMPLGGLFEQWAARGCFMYSMNHPRLHVFEDITRVLLTRAGMSITASNVATYLDDPLRQMSIWPVYPGIAGRLNLHGDYTFIKSMLNGAMSLREFVESSVARYDGYEKETLEPLMFSLPDYRQKLGLDATQVSSTPAAPDQGNPYRSANRLQFWKNAVAGITPQELDPVMRPRLKVEQTDLIATAGSCFAQHIARVLSQSGFNYFVPEQAPDGLDPDEAKALNYGVYSARYGNIYTVRQLLQLMQRVDGDFVPQDDVWLDQSGRHVDPFRPQIQPEGFASREALLRSREEHFAAVRTMFRSMDVFVFTLGLTEGWRSRQDGAVFPLAPGVAGGQMNAERYEFINFTVEEVIADLHRIVDRLASLNPTCRIILTVSPVPLIATYEPRHALVATTYSKSVLRTAADALARSYDHVEYFPSYEIITGSYSRGAYFEEDLRTVREEGVSHVMRVFMDRYTKEQAPSSHEQRAPVAQPAPRRPSLFEIVCDEEAIAKF